MRRPSGDAYSRPELGGLLGRQCVSLFHLAAPGPDARDLEAILTAACHVPDHGRLAPWRFLVVLGDARARFGERLALLHLKLDPEASARDLGFSTNFLLYAPVVIVAISRVSAAKPISDWDQILSCGAACMNLLNAAHALGYAAQWVTDWPARQPEVGEMLGLEPGDRIAGFIHLGTATKAGGRRPRPAPADVTTDWSPG